MREIVRTQLKLGEVDVSKVKIDSKSRDDIPRMLRGIQYLYTNIELRERLFKALEKTIPEKIDRSNGRLGMSLWGIFVLGVLRLNLNCDYDRLQSLANNYKTLREMLGHGNFDEHYYETQTLKDNVRLLTPEVLSEINQIIVTEGHKLLKKKETAELAARCDSFVVKTDVHFPTDINLLFDGLRKSIQLIARLSTTFNVSEWRQYQYNIRQIKKIYREAQQSKRGNIRNERKRVLKIQETHRKYIDVSENFIQKVLRTANYINEQKNLTMIQRANLLEIYEYVMHAKRQINQIIRRVLKEEEIPHKEKVFSLFEPHTEWICKGKLGVPVELGVRLCIVEDKNKFLLHHKIMYKQTDNELTIPMARETKERFPTLHSISYDRGFYSKYNREQLGEILDAYALPKKGKLSKEDISIQNYEDFIKAKEKHSAIESAINALGNHGLDRCLDHGKFGFERYIAIAVVAQNIQNIGTILQKREYRLMVLRERRQKLKAA